MQVDRRNFAQRTIVCDLYPHRFVFGDFIAPRNQAPSLFYSGKEGTDLWFTAVPHYWLRFIEHNHEPVYTSRVQPNGAALVH